MLGYLTLIFTCQLIGELAVVALKLPLPGPVLGMAILFTGLMIKGSVPDDLSAVSDFLLRYLSLLFIPAGVGVMLHAKLIGRDWLPISLSLIVSTALTIVVSAKVMTWLSPKAKEAEARDA